MIFAIVVFMRLTTEIAPAVPPFVHAPIATKSEMIWKEGAPKPTVGAARGGSIPTLWTRLSARTFLSLKLSATYIQGSGDPSGRKANIESGLPEYPVST